MPRASARENRSSGRAPVVDAVDGLRVRPRVSFATYARVRWMRARGDAPTGARDGAGRVSRGPYATRREGTNALRRGAFEEGRCVRSDRTKTSGRRATFACASPACAYEATLARWSAKGGDGQWYVTNMRPHDCERCTSARELTPREIVSHPLARAMMVCLGRECSRADVADIAREVYGDEISEWLAEKTLARLHREASKVRTPREPLEVPREPLEVPRERVHRLYSPQSRRVVNCVERSRRPRARILSR